MSNKYWNIVKKHLGLRPSKADQSDSLQPKLLERAYTTNLHRYEECLPDPPQVILQYRDNYGEFIRIRGYPSVDTDTPLRALYRIYEHLVLDRNIDIRNELERFWFARWPVKDIPDPHDQDEGRYAMLAVATALLARSFNHRIDLCLPRYAPAIITNEDIERFREEEKVFENAPKWASDVQPLSKPLHIPFVNPEKAPAPPEESDPDELSEQAKEKNIIMVQPNIYFI